MLEKHARLTESSNSLVISMTIQFAIARKILTKLSLHKPTSQNYCGSHFMKGGKPFAKSSTKPNKLLYSLIF